MVVSAKPACSEIEVEIDSGVISSALSEMSSFELREVFSDLDVSEVVGAFDTDDILSHLEVSEVYEHIVESLDTELLLGGIDEDERLCGVSVESFIEHINGEDKAWREVLLKGIGGASTELTDEQADALLDSEVMQRAILRRMFKS